MRLHSSHAARVHPCAHLVLLLPVVVCLLAAPCEEAPAVGGGEPSVPWHERGGHVFLVIECFICKVSLLCSATSFSVYIQGACGYDIVYARASELLEGVVRCALLVVVYGVCVGRR